MSGNLALVILLEMMDLAYHRGSGIVKLSDIMNAYDMPRATFYRHVKILVRYAVIEKVSWGNYQLTESFVDAVRVAGLVRQTSFLD